MLPEDVAAAFKALKAAFNEWTLLHYAKPGFDFVLDFVLDVDASKYAIGACLQQNIDGIDVPLAFCLKT